jgi:polyhydroxyalkanoate synthesis regulator phasin
MTKSTIDRLTSLGEEVLGKASKNPTANRVVQSAMQMKERVDDLSKRVRGLEAMQKQIAQLEKRVAKLETGPKRATSSAKKKSATKK